MKHTASVTVLLVLTFLAAQLFGLLLVQHEAAVVEKNGTTTVEYGDTALGERPQTQGGESFIYVVIGVGIGTLLLLLLMKFNKVGIWKAWFFLAVLLAITVALGVFVQPLIAFVVAALLAVWKIWKPNILIHNATEVLMYGGIALLFVPLFNVLWAVLLLLAVSVYDMYAVWKSKHMVKMAEFQAKSNVFAGLYIPYGHKRKHVTVLKHPQKGTIKEKLKHAILGGGDIAFPLIFTGVVLTQLLRLGLTKSAAFLYSSIIVLAATVVLAGLFFYAEKGKFYPAMPFLTGGCLAGYVIVLILL